MIIILTTIFITRYQRRLMWRYTPDKPFIITRELLERVLKYTEDDPPRVTDEAIAFINELYNPYLDKLTGIKRNEDFDRFISDLSNVYLDFDFRKKDNGNLSSWKEQIIEYLVNSLTWDGEVDELGISRNDGLIDPWEIKDYIRNHKITRRLFNLPKHRHDDEIDYKDEDEDYETSPVTLTVTITLGGTKSILDLEHEQLLGVMAVYRHLRIMHPFSYKGHIFADEMEEINTRALKEPIEYDGYYNIRVGNDIYSFTDMSFFQGLLTGAQWNNLDPHNFITDLKEWKYEVEDVKEQTVIEGIGIIPAIGMTIEERKIHAINLNY